MGTPLELGQMRDEAQHMYRKATDYDREVLVTVVRGAGALQSSRKFGENDMQGSQSVSY